MTNQDSNIMDSVQDMRADPYLTEPGQINQINPVQYERVPVVKGHDGSSDRQDAVNVESPHATHTCSPTAANVGFR